MKLDSYISLTAEWNTNVQIHDLFILKKNDFYMVQPWISLFECTFFYFHT